MWFFTSKKRNSLKRERQEKLDVRLRNDPVKEKARHFGAGMVGLVLVLFTLLFFWRLGVWGVNELVLQNPAFTLLKIDVETDGIIPGEQLRKWSGVKIGDSLLALDLGRIRRDIELIPLVESASIERVLPHKLRIRITEREPLMQICIVQPGQTDKWQPSTFYVDVNGFIIPPMEREWRRFGTPMLGDILPVLTGLKDVEIRPGHTLASPEVLGALKMLQAFRKSTMSTIVDIQSIDVSGIQTLVVRTSQNNEITFGLGDFEWQLRRWKSVYDLGLRSEKQIAFLDLAVANYVPLRWAENNVPPSLAPRPKQLNNSPYRKKHV